MLYSRGSLNEHLSETDTLFSWRRDCESWYTEKTVLWIVIEAHPVKRELPKSLIVNTYIEGQKKKINRSFVQMTLTIIWWLDLTSLSSLMM